MTDGRVYTPEDELDELDLELGRWRRRLQDAETARHDSRGCDYVQIDKTITRCRFQIERLERERSELLAEQQAADEAYEMDVA